MRFLMNVVLTAMISSATRVQKALHATKSKELCLRHQSSRQDAAHTHSPQRDGSGTGGEGGGKEESNLFENDGLEEPRCGW